MSFCKSRAGLGLGAWTVAAIAGALAASTGGCSSTTELAFGTGGSGASSTTTTTTTTSAGGGGGIPVGCGDGELGPNETCDGALLGGADCTDLGYSTAAGLACAADCTFDAAGCHTTCDGALLEPGEACDGAALGGQDCTDLGYVDPAGLACNDCQLDPTGCASQCGNDTAEPTEVCDGQDVGAVDCTDYGYASPNGLACAFDCSDYSTAGCVAQCNNGLLEPDEVCDGASLGGHDCTELGYVDPNGLGCFGCALDPSGCSAFCGNGVPEPTEECDDGNGTGGDGCDAFCQLELPSGATCAEAIPVTLANGTQSFVGSTVGGGTHGSTSCPADAPDRVYAVTPQSDGFLTARLRRAATSFDSVLYVSTACNDGADVNTIVCEDSWDPQNVAVLFGGELVSLRVTPGTTYFVHVDGYLTGDEGDYELVLDLSLGRTCADPVPITLEVGTPMTALGSNVGNLLDQVGSCGGNPGDEIVYAIQRSTAGPVSVATVAPGTDYNSVLYARTTCNDAASELACSNQALNAMESVALGQLAAGTVVYLWVDGSQTGGGNAFGNYRLTLTP
ncbi:MAG: hypothetical protein IT373_31930 [Polyangiaceae bacterium]|nr:hypothetical protein [Polyangiaceae bacterium]